MTEWSSPERITDIQERHAAITERIVRACTRAGRSPEDVTLIGVSKTFPPDLIAAAQAAGLCQFGENKVQELITKATTYPGTANGGTLTWHYIGHLQRNKAKDVVAHADLFHALDSIRLANTLNQRAAQTNRRLPCLIQVNVSGEASKFGLTSYDVSAVLDHLVTLPHLEIRGFMTLAAPTPNPEEVRTQFRLLRDIRDQSQTAHPSEQLTYLSMGMSGDFEVAIEEGATHIRIGTALFGRRG